MVLLKNGANESLSRVESIHLDLYSLQVEHPLAFKLLCVLCRSKSLPSAAGQLDVLRRLLFVDEGNQPWDDVRDVVQSGTEKVGGQWRRCYPLK